MPWNHNLRNLFEVMEAMVVTDRTGAMLDADAGFSLLADWVRECREKRRRIYFVGNGASASMASHFSADLGKMAGVPTEVFTDCALITATGNDMGYDQTFAYPLGLRMVPGEMLVAISSSGNSPNTVEAVKAAGRLSGRAVTFTAMGSDNAMRSLGDLNFYLPAKTYGLAECGHSIALHHLVDLF